MRVFLLFIFVLIGDDYLDLTATNDLQFLLEEKYRIIEGQDNVPLLGDIATGVFDSSGNLYVVDNGNVQIHKFSPDGIYVQSLGGKGRGPGEFLQATESIALKNDQSVYIIDYPNQRVVGFDVNTGEVVESFSLKSTTAVRFNKLHFFNDNLLFLGSHQKEDVMIHQLNSSGETVSSFGEFIQFKNFQHNNNGKIQLSLVHISSHSGKMLVGLAAPNRMKLYDQGLNKIHEIEDEMLPIPWETHMTMEPHRYSSKFYSMSYGNQILSNEYYLYHWAEIVDQDKPEVEFHLELRSLKDGKLIFRENLEDLNIVAMSRISDNKAMLLTRDSNFNYAVQELTIKGG